MLQLCSYETVALGYSAFCPLFTQEDFLNYEYFYDLVRSPYKTRKLYMLTNFSRNFTMSVVLAHRSPPLKERVIYKNLLLDLLGNIPSRLQL